MFFEEEREREEEGATEYYMPYDKLPGESPHRADDAIRRDIESSLFYEELVRSYEVKVDVQDGVVTLSGTVGSPAEKLAAERDTRRVPGVREVRNNIEVRQRQ